METLTRTQAEELLFIAEEQVDYLECMSLKRCNPKTIEVIQKELKQVYWKIDELEQYIGDLK